MQLSSVRVNRRCTNVSSTKLIAANQMKRAEMERNWQKRRRAHEAVERRSPTSICSRVVFMQEYAAVCCSAQLHSSRDDNQVMLKGMHVMSSTRVKCCRRGRSCRVVSDRRTGSYSWSVDSAWSSAPNVIQFALAVFRKLTKPRPATSRLCFSSCAQYVTAAL